MNIQTSDELGPKIIKALGLPEHTKRFELAFEAGKPVSVKCEALVLNLDSEAEGYVSEFSEYELRKIESPNVDVTGAPPHEQEPKR